MAKASDVKEMVDEGADKEEKKWIDLQGNKTSNDTQTHWDEHGFLDIREDFTGSDENDTSGQETEAEVLGSDQVRQEGVPIVKSPADIRKLMERV